MTVTSDRLEFCAAVLECAVGHGGHGWFGVDEANLGDSIPFAERYALVTEQEPDGVTRPESQRFRLTPQVVEEGIRVIQRAVAVPLGDRRVALRNEEKDRWLEMSRSYRHDILAAYHSDDAGQVDVVMALAIVECAVFGYVACC